MASAHDIMQRMKQVQAAREKVFEPLAEILGKREELQRQLAELDAPYADAFVAAEAAGWTTDELKAIGAEEPTKRPRGRTRGRRAQRKETDSGTPGLSTTVSAAASPEASIRGQEGAGDPATAATGSMAG
ncbi:hypothetical protein ACIPWL_31700 [Streptomyces sp. NPDC090023]|uniref:hypothetical protein n=1 Tax=unclassified Streptomyces TaxID=2593676 RepID=UPI00382BB4F5